MSPTANNARAALRTSGLFLLIIFGLPPVIAAWALRLEPLRALLVLWFYKTGVFICGLRIRVQGELSSERPLMIVSNHTSYIDVFIIGSLVRVSFTPKKEVRRWPLIGFMCLLSDCVFVERRPAEMQAAAAEMKKRLAKGKVLCLFPEGTTSDGFHIKPFKSGFLSLAEIHDLPVQPASIAFTHIGREPITAERRDEVAWVGDATFFGHFWHFLSLPPLRVEVQLHPARRIAEFVDRKALAQACEQTVVAGVNHLLKAHHEAR